jgi:hypothetical protein
VTQHEITWSRNLRDDDFAAFDGELRIGRVYRISGGPGAGKWSWTRTVLIDGTRVGNDMGVADDLAEARLRVEIGYRAFQRRIAEDGP